MKIRWKPLLLNLLISLGGGALSGLFTKNSMGIYEQLNLPPLAPAPSVFPVVWGILYFLMGISAYLITISDSKDRSKALWLYGIQLAVNLLWPVFFFVLHWYLFAFFWLFLLLILLVAMISAFKKLRPAAAWLQIPYFLWTAFAGYLNLGIYLLNR